MDSIEDVSTVEDVVTGVFEIKKGDACSDDSGNDTDSQSKPVEHVHQHQETLSVLDSTKSQEKNSEAEMISEATNLETSVLHEQEPERSEDSNQCPQNNINSGNGILTDIKIEKEIELEGKHLDKVFPGEDIQTNITVKEEIEYECENSTVACVKTELMEYREASADEESSASDSSDSSDDESGPESGFHPGSSEEDEDEAALKAKKCDEKAEHRVPTVNKTVKTKGELGLEDLPPIDDLQITVEENVKMYQVGSVTSCVGLLVVVQAVPDSPALNVDSVLFMEDRQVLGQVFEVLGPVAKPLYTVRFNSVTDIETKGIMEGTLVFYAPDKDEFTKFVFLTELKKMKGSDASWEHNNEPPPRFLDYSDDESERRAKRGETIDNDGKMDSTNCAKERGGKFNKHKQEGQQMGGNNRNKNKRNRKGYQSWPPKPGDFAENSNFPPPPTPPEELPRNYPGFQLQQARSFQQDPGFRARGPRPANNRFQNQPRPQCFGPPGQNGPSNWSEPPGNGQFHSGSQGNNLDPRFLSSNGNPAFCRQPPPSNRGSGTGFTDQAPPGFGPQFNQPPRFGGQPQFHSARHPPPSSEHQQFPPQNHRNQNLYNTSHDQNYCGQDWGNRGPPPRPYGHPPRPQDQQPRPFGQPSRPYGQPPGSFRPPTGPPNGPFGLPPPSELTGPPPLQQMAPPVSASSSSGPFSQPLRPSGGQPSGPFSHNQPFRPSFDQPPCSNSNLAGPHQQSTSGPLPPRQNNTPPLAANDHPSFQDVTFTTRPPPQNCPNVPTGGPPQTMNNAPRPPNIVDHRFMQRQT